MKELIEPFARLLQDHCSPVAVRAIERGATAEPLWGAIAESGFLDALVSESAGGAGLRLIDVAPLFALLGAHAVPLPVGETMIARALLAKAGREVPSGPITIASGAGPVPLARVARYVLVGSLEQPVAQPVEAAEPTGLDRDLDGWLPVSSSQYRPLGAVLRACLIAGAVERVLAMTLGYANERVQFGRPIGRQQAVQVQLAVLAEQAVAARLAAEMGASQGWTPHASAIGIAKHGAGLAAAHAVSISHAVFGAIGISEEHDLQLLTRRLDGWRRADGGERYWSAIIGREMMRETGLVSGHIRAITTPRQ